MSNATAQTLYKLTDENGKTMPRTPHVTQWGENVMHTAKGNSNQDLCSNGWIHAYTNPYLAILLNPIHANFKNPRLWEAKGIVGKSDNRLKVGCRTLTTVKEISIPILTTEQRIEFAIRCALQVIKNPHWVRWAKNWLSGKDRTAAAARAAAWAAEAATRAAAWAAEWAAAEAAEWAAEWAAARAAEAAAQTAEAAARAKDDTLLIRILLDMGFIL